MGQRLFFRPPKVEHKENAYAVLRNKAFYLPNLVPAIQITISNPGPGPPLAHIDIGGGQRAHRPRSQVLGNLAHWDQQVEQEKI